MVARRARSIVLQFDPARDALPSGKRLSEGISAAFAVDGTLWLTHDETVTIERLGIERSGARSVRFARHRRFDLGELLPLPVPRPRPGEHSVPEADLEGIAYCDGYVWVAGSHSALRDGRDAIDELARVRRAGNRFLLARIPVATDGDDGPRLVPRYRSDDGRVLRAARLTGGPKNDALTHALRDDPLLGPFLAIPSKDNGFDIEGLAAAPDGRLFLGLRGPVIDGLACVLEIHVAEHRDRRDSLALRKLARSAAAPTVRALYRKHLLDLGGAGIRDLCLAGRDLLVLTGPPMRGKGQSKVRLWRNALATRGERMLRDDDLPTLLELPYREKKDHAEAITVVGRRRNLLLVLVIHDSVARHRRVPPAGMRATLHALTVPR
ncbi:MAG TPA: DUF3616 domain-containing protein [Casimicrobiaceae bacterium]|nr:DUF3616 domain-containing protein [Casimicrobiaceae bacterium]